MRIFLLGFLTLLFSCTSNNKTITENSQVNNSNDDTMMTEENIDTATFGAGCFWCVETLFAQLKGVKAVYSGYMGGQLPNPTYREVCSGRTGHAEIIQIEFDSSIISYNTLLEVFWSVHDPTTLNRQGADQGTQYRSAVFFHSPEQEASARKVKEEIGLANIWDEPIVTEINAASIFYKAEQYHQDYYNQNSEESYCKIVINPKVSKFRKKFEHLLK